MMEVNIGKLKIAYNCVEPDNSTGDEKKSPIIILHGTTASKEYWNDVLLPIANGTGRKVYAYDARNHGDSDWNDNMKFSCLVDDHLQFMKCLNIEKAILIGHSMGAKTAMYFALKWPDKVEQLIIEDTSPLKSARRVHEQLLQYIDLAKMALKRMPAEVKDLLKAKYFVYDFILQHMPKYLQRKKYECAAAPFLTIAQDENGAYNWKGNLDVYGEVSELDDEECTGKYMGPALMLYGTRSGHRVLNDKEYISALFPRVTFIPVEGATHQIHLNYLDVFLKEVIHFINTAGSKKIWEKASL